MRYRDIRRKTKAVRVGDRYIGGDYPIPIQSMTNADPHDAKAIAYQMLNLQERGCDIVRLTIPDREAADLIPHIRSFGVRIPMVADIHFDYRLALRCAELGIDKIRINPGNIGNEARVAEVARVCRERDIPIRIGVNSGSLEHSILEKYGGPTPEALCESAQYHVSLLEKYDFDHIVVSIKASSVDTMIRANRLFAASSSYPLHLGVTEAGNGDAGLIKSAIGIGSLLCDGIGDTMRVSLTDDPLEEISAAQNIINALHIEGQSGIDIVSCPTCGRTQIDLMALSAQLKQALIKEGLQNAPLKVALMGCVVNGPGEAREADIGIAGGAGVGLLIRHGEIIEKLPEDRLIPRLIEEIRHLAEMEEIGRKSSSEIR